MKKSELKRKTTINPDNWEAFFDEQFAENIMGDGCFDGKTEDVKAFIRILLTSYKARIAQTND